jgi:S-adenosylmethionine hydrolase
MRFGHTLTLLWFSLLVAVTPIHARPVVALLTDFGLANEAVGLCHGVILKTDTNIQIIDLCHNLQPYNIHQAALVLRRSTGFPKGTVFTAVVDPGVGTQREAVAVKTTKGFLYVGPNNGVFSEVIRLQGAESVWKLDEKRVNPAWSPGTFDGRDLFCPAAAILASTSGGLSRVGHPMPLEQLVLLPPMEAQVSPEEGKIVGHYLVTDEPYGNVWTDITRENLSVIGLHVGDQLQIENGARKWEVPWVISFGYVPAGQPLGYLASGDTFALAINMGDLRKEWGLTEGMEITLRKLPTKTE